MSVDWNGYQPSDPGVTAALKTLAPAEARAAYERLMQAKAGRIEALHQLLKANGVALGYHDEAIQDLNDWFYSNVEPDPEHPGRLLPIWFSVANDIALFLGDVMIERHPQLRWEFFTWGNKNAAYHRPVIMGFTTEDPKFHTNIDLHRSVTTYASRILAQRGSMETHGTVTVRGVQIDVDAAAAQHSAREIETDAFWRWLQNAANRA